MPASGSIGWASTGAADFIEATGVPTAGGASLEPRVSQGFSRTTATTMASSTAMLIISVSGGALAAPVWLPRRGS